MRKVWDEELKAYTFPLRGNKITTRMDTLRPKC